MVNSIAKGPEQRKAAPIVVVRKRRGKEGATDGDTHPGQDLRGPLFFPDAVS